jgi:hypothetical protein
MLAQACERSHQSPASALELQETIPIAGQGDGCAIGGDDQAAVGEEPALQGLARRISVIHT